MAKKKQLKKDKYAKQCQDCVATCCHNLAVEIGEPETPEEIEDLRWQLHFDRVKVYIADGRWYQWIESKCMYLAQDNLCSIYDTRPYKCREHNPPNCEEYGKFYDVMISTPQELDKFFAK